MSIGVERLKTEMAAPSPSDRAELASFLLNTLDATGDEGTEAAWDEELERRADEIRRGVALGRPVEDVFADIKAAHS